MKTTLFLLTLTTLLLPAMRAEDVVLPPSHADEQVKQADAILYFDGPDRMYFERPEKQSEPFALTSLAERVTAATPQRTMIVVIMSKPTRLWLDDKFKVAVDDLEARLRKSGFKKVAFHLASGTYPTPIYSE
ncbi:MAG: hypothetical protein ABJF10_20605 [Chthoniobacter sp.]|uniref:hypothetical protein n=1 Tax=Chthoniobacter sp. TaxID=2510640 RepID=UPI0032AC32CC